MEASEAECRRTEEALSSSEVRFRTMIESTVDAIVIVDKNGRVRFVNPAAESLFGRKAKEFLGKSLGFPVVPGEKAEIEVVHKSGGVVMAEMRVAETEWGGEPAYLVSIRDITDRKHAEEELRAEALIFENIHDGIIVTDLDGDIIRWNQAAEGMFGYMKNEIMRRTVDMLTTRVIRGTLRDGRWAGEVNFIRKDGSEGICETRVLPLLDERDYVTAVFGVCHDITERKRAEEELRKSFEKLQQALEGAVGVLTTAVEMRDPYTAGHQQRVTGLACAIAEEIDLSEERREGLRMAGLIHDLGKINVPAEILSKPGRLSEIEYNVIKTHPQSGYEILKPIEFPWPLAQIVLQHHERINGAGYPTGLSGNDILLEAKILAVADVVEAMASHRPYRPALGIDKALEEILLNKGILYDHDVVAACQRVFDKGRFTFK